MNFWDHWYGWLSWAHIITCIDILTISNQFGIQLSWLFHEELTETLVGACLGRLAILTEMSQNQSLDFGNKFQSDFYTSDEMSKFKKCLWLQIAMMINSFGRSHEKLWGCDVMWAYVSCGLRPTKKPKRKNRTKVDHSSYKLQQEFSNFSEVFPMFFFAVFFLAFWIHLANLGLSWVGCSHPRWITTQSGVQIKLNWRLFKSETVRVKPFWLYAMLQHSSAFFLHSSFFGSVLLLAMTHSKCFVTAEQNAAYAALMPQTSSIQVGISECVFWKPTNLCVFFRSHFWFQAPRTTVCHWLSGDLRTSGYRTLPGGAEGCLDAAGRGVGLGCFEVGFLL